MLRHRIIPCLLLLNEGLVKTQQFKNPKYVGDPTNAIRIFNEKEVDELIILDIKASKEGREPNFKLIENMAGECFMPLCYGGGISNIDQVRRLFSIGVEKICVQTAAISNLKLITEIADKFGNQAITVSVDVKKDWLGRYRLHSLTRDFDKKETWIGWMKSAVDAGAGEIILNCVDNDGMMKGLNLDLIKLAAKAINVPLIAIGGVGSISDIREGIDAGASAISAGSFFVFHGPHRAVLITYPEYERINF